MKILKKKIMIAAGIHLQLSNCVKFHDCAIFDLWLPQSFGSKLQQTNTKTDENEMPFLPTILILILSCETIIRNRPYAQHCVRFSVAKKLANTKDFVQYTVYNYRLQIRCEIHLDNLIP